MQENTPKLITILIAAGLLFGCGGGAGREGGVSHGPSGSKLIAGMPIDIRGSVKNNTGSQTEMASWVIAFIERDSGISKVADIDRAGNYTLNSVNTNRPQTVILLNPSYRLEAVLSQPTITSGIVSQYFIMDGNIAPTIVQSGSILEFADTSNITITSDIAVDSDGNRIPDGMEDGVLRFVNGQDTWFVDSDMDGIPNHLDVDIDGDGIANWFDSDDNGNGLLDIFDPDANGSGMLDSGRQTQDSYFPEFIEYLAVQVIQEMQMDNSISNSLVFTTRVRPGYDFDTIMVKGPNSLFDGSTARNIDLVTGMASLQSWDKTLVGNGLNQDKGDGLYTRTVVLATGKMPRANQVIFLQLVKGFGATAVNTGFPYTFPAVTTGSIEGTWAVDKLTVSGNPFMNFLDPTISILDYSWSMHVFNAQNIKVYSSASFPGKTTAITIPKGVLDAATPYTSFVVAKSLDKVPSYPAWLIKSKWVSLTWSESQ